MNLRTIGRMAAIVLTLLFVPMAQADRPPSVYLGGNAEVGVVLLHGHGGTAEGNVVGPLARMFNTEFGYHALSLDLPQVAGMSAGPQLAVAYAPLYPEVEQRIARGIDFLVREKQVKTLYLVGFSVGTRMMTAYLASHPDLAVAGYVSVSTSCGGPEPMDSNVNLTRITVPVLDIYGTGSAPDVRCAADRKALPAVVKGYTVVQIPGAPHNFRGYEDQLSTSVANWVRAMGGAKQP